MRVRLKGINTVTKRLADGTLVKYHYAWKGGPRLQGEPDTPEFYASYIAALDTEKRAPGADLQSLIDDYLQSSAFMNLAQATKKSYKVCITRIESAFGDLPLSALEERKVRGVFLQWRDELGVRSRRQADHSMTVLARIVSWGCDRGIIGANHCRRAGRLYKGSRSENVWTVEHERAFYEKAPSHLHLALKLGVWTGQRQRDLLELRWSQFDGTHIRFKQQKTGAYVPVPAATPLREALEQERERLHVGGIDVTNLADTTVLQTTFGTPWTSMGFSCSWRKGCARAGVVGVTFHDLRGTAVTRLAVAGCSVPEIAAITGHSLKDVDAILDKHYLKRDPEIAMNAIRKLERSLKIPTERPTDD